MVKMPKTRTLKKTRKLRRSPNPPMRVTVFDIIKRVLPQGTGAVGKTQKANWDDPPLWPPDVFAVSAFLLERSGAYAYLIPGLTPHWGQPWFVVSQLEREEWQEAAAAWKSDIRTPSAVQRLWDELLAKSKAVKFSEIPENALPEWVRAAVGLMVISDEACSDVGYLHEQGNVAESSWIALMQLELESDYIVASTENQEAGFKMLKRHQFSLTRLASLDLVAVQPKAHTAQVGASLRAITHNLALLPPPSRMGATWQRVVGSYGDGRELNLLLIPFPYSFDEAWITSHPSGESGKGWEWFDIEQSWLPKNKNLLADFVSSLVLKAEKDMREAGDENCHVHVLIFPEFALTWDHYAFLVDHLGRKHPDLEFVVSGSSSNCEKAFGNFALTSTISRFDGYPIIHTNSRGKHHRWRLDKSQINAYALHEKLDENTLFWEGIVLQKRMIHTHVFRNTSCFTTLICEDLARSDPAHETVRSIGPSIVFCLLMDGAQIPGRWSSRYAEGLVEDPGSAVLTFTSRGLIERYAEKRVAGGGDPAAQSWSIALWRDKKSGAVTINCPPDNHAALLKLISAPLAEDSLDGRRNATGVSWSHAETRLVQLTPSEAQILDEF